MATAKDKIGSNLIFAGLERIIFVPWVKTEGVWAKGTTGFCLDDVVADTTAVTQEDNEVNSVECETRDEPITENITLGARNFTCESANLDADILEHCLGFIVTKTGDKITAAYAPAVYQERWAEIELQFQNGYSLVLPKVKLSSTIDASSLKTGVVRGIVSGTCYSTQVAEGITTSYYVSGEKVNTVGTVGG